MSWFLFRREAKQIWHNCFPSKVYTFMLKEHKSQLLTLVCCFMTHFLDLWDDFVGRTWHIILIWSWLWEEKSYHLRKQWRQRSACVDAQADLCFHYSLRFSMEPEVRIVIFWEPHSNLAVWTFTFRRCYVWDFFSHGTVPSSHLNYVHGPRCSIIISNDKNVKYITEHSPIVGL